MTFNDQSSILGLYEIQSNFFTYPDSMDEFKEWSDLCENHGYNVSYEKWLILKRRAEIKSIQSHG